MTRKIEDEVVHKMCKMMEEGYNNKEISDVVNVTASKISSIRCGHIYTDISKHYNMPKLCLTNNEVHKICEMMENGSTNMEISKKFNICKETISRVRCGKVFKNISKKYNIKKMSMDDETVHKICQSLVAGEKNIDIAKKFNISKDSVAAIRRGVSHTKIRNKYDINVKEQTTVDERTVHRICRLLEDGYTNTEISIDCNVSKQLVSEIRCGKTHIKISEQYNIEEPKRQRRRIPNDALHLACKLLESGYSISATAKQTHLSVSTIERVKYTKIYSDITCNYNFNNKKDV